MKRTAIPASTVAAFLLFLLSCKSSKVSDPDTTILDKYWKLLEIKSNPIQNRYKEPHLILRSAETRVVGNGGCNSFFGSYQLTGNQILFSQIGATKMACGNMQEESAFFQVFAATRSYLKKRNELFLKDSLGMELAKFEFVEGKN
jgi:heat shock protein HslJ